MTNDSSPHPAATPAADYSEITESGAVRVERLLPGPIERVWSYLTDSNKRGTWLASGEMDLRVGGRYEFVFRDNSLTKNDDPAPEKYADIADESRFSGHILALDPPRLLHIAWAEGTEEESEVRFELTPAGDKVRLVLTHVGLERRDHVVGVSAGWHVHVDILASRLAGSEPEGFWRAFNRLEREYEERISSMSDER